MDSSVLLMTFREMVNADRTVIATVDQPSAAVFQLFDTLMLLSKGRVIYHGPIKTAAQYFMASPFGFDMTGYNNPADYLVDISGGFIKDKKVSFLNCFVSFPVSENVIYHAIDTYREKRLTRPLSKTTIELQNSMHNCAVDLSKRVKRGRSTIL